MNIAFVGKLGSGKSTAARMLEKDGWVRHSWAEPVRYIFGMAFEPITPENYATVKAKKYDVSYDGLPTTMTGRELLQRIGTEAMREQVDQDFWLKCGLRSIEDSNSVGAFVVNDDTRFLNEADALRKLGFRIVRIVRPGQEDTGTHPSEVEQEHIFTDRTIWNDGSIEELNRQVRMLVNGDTPTVTDVTTMSNILLSAQHHGEDGVTFDVEREPGGWYTCCGATEHILECPQWR